MPRNRHYSFRAQLCPRAPDIDMGARRGNWDNEILTARMPTGQNTYQKQRQRSGNRHHNSRAQHPLVVDVTCDG